MPEDPEERQGHPLWGRQICSVLEQRKEHLETIIRREKREMRYSGQLHRKYILEHDALVLFTGRRDG